ncbi:MAG TPA: AAA family ATPase, partial [Candidatus Competibacteraceae bacterium]|nr:AAA family ATPase [Candidatus Competibacteraceae bacterium]
MKPLPLPIKPAIPLYEPFGDERAVFESAWRNRLPLLIKG